MNLMQFKVREFHRQFGVDAPSRPVMPAHEVQVLREKLIAEELGEFIEANQRGSIVDVADAIADILYVTFGAAVAYGIDMESIFEEVHRSNMSKIGKDGKINKRADGKVIKPPTYSPADVKGVLKKQMEVLG